jgi:hypothetical protein
MARVAYFKLKPRSFALSRRSLEFAQSAGLARVFLAAQGVSWSRMTTPTCAPARNFVQLT